MNCPHHDYRRSVQHTLDNPYSSAGVVETARSHVDSLYSKRLISLTKLNGDCGNSSVSFPVVTSPQIPNQWNSPDQKLEPLKVLTCTALAYREATSRNGKLQTIPGNRYRGNITQMQDVMSCRKIATSCS